MTAQDSPTTSTLEYYNQNAASFARSTVNVEFSQMQDRFCSRLEPGARILDFGCGSGRDAKAFIDAGFEVTAIDGSAELCKIASELIGAPVKQMLFQELDEVGAYDGIWACSSILHLTREELPGVLRRMERALVDDGIIYTSFKLGNFEGVRGGRYFTNFTEETFRALLEEVPELEIEELWVTGDVRPGRENEQWLNLILGKR